MQKQQKDFTEYEAKFYPVVKDEYRKKLTQLGAKLVNPERIMRRAMVDRLDYPQLSCDYIRVRDEGNCVRLSAKTHAGSDGKLSDQKEIDVEVSDFDHTVKIIESMGFIFGFYQESLRETWEYRGAEITIDTWPGLESYSEIEADSEGRVREIATYFGFQWENRIITGVGQIYMRIYSLPFDLTLEKLKHITFENNPFDSIKSR